MVNSVYATLEFSNKRDNNKHLTWIRSDGLVTYRCDAKMLLYYRRGNLNAVESIGTLKDIYYP